MSKVFLGVFSLFILIACETTPSTPTAPASTVEITQGGEIRPVDVRTLNIEGLSTPESVSVNKGIVYVANIGSNPRASTSKGFVFLNNDVIIVSDHPNVRTVRISTGAVLDTEPITGAGFLNDMVLINSTAALLTDTGTGKIYKLTVDGSFQITTAEVTGISDNINGINGIAYDGTKLYFVTSTFGGTATQGHIYEATSTDNFNSITSLTQWSSTQQGAGRIDSVAFYENYLMLYQIGELMELKML